MSNTKEINSKPRLHISLSTCYLEYAPPPPQVFVRTDGCSLVRPYADVITKFSRLDELLFSFTHGALLARFALRSSATNKNHTTNKLTTSNYCTEIAFRHTGTCRTCGIYFGSVPVLISSIPKPFNIQNTYGNPQLQ